jgi:cytochrome c-type biogenesis protein CcmF
MPRLQSFLIVLTLVLLLLLAEFIAWKARRAGEKKSVTQHDLGPLRTLSAIFCVMLASFLLISLIGVRPAADCILHSGSLLPFGESVRALGGKVFEPHFYNRVCVPLLIFVALLLCLCPWQSWQGGMRKPRVTLLIVAVLLISSTAIWFARHDLLFSSAGLPNLAAMAELARNDPMMAEQLRPAFNQARLFGILAALAGGIAVASLLSLTLQMILNPATRQERRTRAAWGVHLGVILFLLGAAFSGPYKRETDGGIRIESHDPEAEDSRLVLDEYTVRLDRLENLVSIVLTPGSDPVIMRRSETPPEYFTPFSPKSRDVHYESLMAVLSVYRDGKKVGTLTPERRHYTKYSAQRFTEVATSFSLGTELYAILSGTDKGMLYVTFSVHPLVNWMWIGTIVMCLAPLLALPGVSRRRAPEKEPESR